MSTRLWYHKLTQGAFWLFVNKGIKCTSLTVLRVQRRSSVDVCVVFHASAAVLLAIMFVSFQILLWYYCRHIALGKCCFLVYWCLDWCALHCIGSLINIGNNELCKHGLEWLDVYNSGKQSTYCHCQLTLWPFFKKKYQVKGTYMYFPWLTCSVSKCGL